MAKVGVRVGEAVGVKVTKGVAGTIVGCIVAVGLGLGVTKLGGSGVKDGLLTADVDTSIAI